MAIVHAIGQHRMLVDEDWVELRFVGQVGLRDSVMLHAHLAAVLLDHRGRAYVLADITRMEGLEADARRDMSAWNATHRVTAAAVFGGGFAVRTIVTLALKAIKLRDPDQLELVFTREEPEARAWLLAERARRGPGTAAQNS